MVTAIKTMEIGTLSDSIKASALGTSLRGISWINQDNSISIKGGYPNIIKTKSKGSLVKINRHKFLEGWFRSFVGFSGFKGLRGNPYCIYDKLGRQIKLLSAIIINKIMEFISIMGFRIKTFVRDILNTFRILFYNISKKFFFRNFNLNSSYGLHNNPYNFNIYKIFGGWQFLPALKNWVSLP